LTSSEQNLFAPVKSKRTFEEVADNVKEMIFNGALQVGDRLPSEAQLARQFEVGRQTVREALRQLELSGFVSIQRGGGGGAVINDAISLRIGDLLSDALRLKRVTLAELTEARVEIESLVLNRLFANPDKKGLAALKRNVAQAQERIKTDQKATDLNAQFHTLLAKATGNEVFVLVVEVIMAVHMNLLEEVGVSFLTSAKTVKAHAQLLQAIEDKDRALASKLLIEHLVEVKSRLINAEKNPR